MAGSVDWGRYNLPAIWTMMKDENVCDGADRVLGWDTLSQDVRDQHRRLLAARDKLAEVWPPERNASSRVFLTYVTYLATSMSETLTAAEDTRVGLQGIMNAIGTAQSTLSPIVQERQAKSTDFIPHFVDHAEDDYDRAGQQAMRVAEAAIQDHGSQIKVPQLYRLNPAIMNPPTDLPEPGKGSTSSDGNSAAAVPVPVPVRHDPPDFGNGDTSDAAGGDAQGGPSGTGGLGLAGVVPLAPAPSAGLGGSVSALGVAPPAGGFGVGGIPASGLPGLVIGGGGAFGLGARGAAAGGFGGGFDLGPRGGVIGGREPVSIRRGLPSGATIGAGESEGGLSGRGLVSQAPFVGGPAGRGVTGRAGTSRGAACRGGTSWGSAGRGATERGSPIGGSAGRAEVGGGSPIDGSAGRGRRAGAAEEELISVEADLRWGVRFGVEPVIEPDAAPARHDPGPGIIGLVA